MNVRSAIPISSTHVTAAPSYMKDQAGHTCDIASSFIGPTVEFMGLIYRWYLIMGVCNCVQYLHLKLPDVRQFDNAKDDRLERLQGTFRVYRELLKRQSPPERFFLARKPFTH